MSSTLNRYWPRDRIEWLGRLKVRARKVGHVVTVSNQGERHMPMFYMSLRATADNKSASGFFDIGELEEAIARIEASA